MYLSCINREGRVGVYHPTNTSFHNIPIENRIKVPRDKKVLLASKVQALRLTIDRRISLPSTSSKTKSQEDYGAAAPRTFTTLPNVYGARARFPIGPLSMETFLSSLLICSLNVLLILSSSPNEA